MKLEKCRWGFLGAATIARKNWRALLASGNSELIAVSARKIDAAKQFVDECQSQVPHPHCPIAVEGYQAMIDRQDIDAIYIPLPTALRSEWVVKALDAGKHVLAEKPSAVDLATAESFVKLANKKKLQYMDGVMFMHSLRLKSLGNALHRENAIGDLHQVTCQFSFNGGVDFQATNIRADSRYEPHGCLGDLGWYCARMILWAFEWEMPERVEGRWLRSFKGPQSPGEVPSAFLANLGFSGKRNASFFCSFETNHQQWAHFSGTDGTLRVRDFVLPYHGAEATFEIDKPEFEVDGCDFMMIERQTELTSHEHSQGRSNSQEVNMFRTFSKNVLNASESNGLSIDPHWGEITLKTQNVIDQLFSCAVR